MTTIETNGRTLVVVEVPEGASDFFINNVGCIRYILSKWSCCLEPIQLGFYATKDEHKIIGLLSELTAEQCEPYINYSEMNPDIIDYEEDLLGYILRSNGIDTHKPILIIEKLK